MLDKFLNHTNFVSMQIHNNWLCSYYAYLVVCYVLENGLLYGLDQVACDHELGPII